MNDSLKAQIEAAAKKHSKVVGPTRFTDTNESYQTENAGKDFLKGCEYVASLNVMPLYEALQKIIDLYPPTEEWAIRRHNDIREVAYKVLSLPLPESAGVWVKAGIGSLPEKHKEVIVRNIKNGKVKKTNCMGHYLGWDIAMDRDFFYDDTEWLDESRASLSNKEDGWKSEKPEFKEPCLLITRQLIRGEYEFEGFVIHWYRVGDDNHLSVLGMDGVWWGPLEDLKADGYLVIEMPQPPKNK